jgi:type I restriction enzyme M protein
MHQVTQHKFVSLIPFNRHFYVSKRPRPLAAIDAERKGVTNRILTMIGGLTK